MHLRQWFDIAFLRLRSLFGRGRVERELRFHLDRETEANLRLGLSPPEARLAALRRLGGMAQVEEECRDMRRTGYIENFVRDLQYAARTLLQSPGFAFAIVTHLGAKHRRHQRHFHRRRWRPAALAPLSSARPPSPEWCWESAARWCWDAFCGACSIKSARPIQSLFRQSSRQPSPLPRLPATFPRGGPRPPIL